MGKTVNGKKPPAEQAPEEQKITAELDGEPGQPKDGKDALANKEKPEAVPQLNDPFLHMCGSYCAALALLFIFLALPMANWFNTPMFPDIVSAGGDDDDSGSTNGNAYSPNVRCGLYECCIVTACADWDMVLTLNASAPPFLRQSPAYAAIQPDELHGQLQAARVFMIFAAILMPFGACLCLYPKPTNVRMPRVRGCITACALLFVFIAMMIMLTLPVPKGFRNGFVLVAGSAGLMPVMLASAICLCMAPVTTAENSDSKWVANPVGASQVATPRVSTTQEVKVDISEGVVTPAAGGPSRLEKPEERVITHKLKHGVGMKQSYFRSQHHAAGLCTLVALTLGCMTLGCVMQGILGNCPDSDSCIGQQCTVFGSCENTMCGPGVVAALFALSWCCMCCHAGKSSTYKLLSNMRTKDVASSIVDSVQNNPPNVHWHITMGHYETRHYTTTTTYSDGSTSTQHHSYQTWVTTHTANKNVRFDNWQDRTQRPVSMDLYMMARLSFTKTLVWKNAYTKEEYYRRMRAFKRAEDNGDTMCFSESITVAGMPGNDVLAAVDANHVPWWANTGVFIISSMLFMGFPYRLIIGSLYVKESVNVRKLVQFRA